MIDLHCHVLPGIDDGPETLEESVALARVAVDAGIDTLVATPHVNSRTPNDSATIARLVDTLNQRLDEEHVDLEVLPGGEIAISHLAEIEPQELSRLGLGGGPWLLVEPPFTPVAVGLAGMVQGVQRLGHRVVLAHPERCPALQRDRQTVRALAEGGVLMSITAGSLTGRFGNEVRRFALELAREGLIHNVTSDAHDSVRRPPGLAEQIEHAGLGPLLEWLTQMVPAAILAGEEMPPRPAAARDGARRRRGWRLRR
ncbi:MAG: CpsB/CapC family capsule biosynthesis tyrosine phosphatase [Solirubrobacteraceae bacterium]|jgi:protein-tyrosine phosphatase